MLRLTRNTYQHGWIETRRRKSRTSYLSIAGRERKPAAAIQNDLK